VSVGREDIYFAHLSANMFELSATSALRGCAGLCENSIGVLRLNSGRTVKYLILLTLNPFVLRPLDA